MIEPQPIYVNSFSKNQQTNTFFAALLQFGQDPKKNDLPPSQKKLPLPANSFAPADAANKKEEPTEADLTPDEKSAGEIFNNPRSTYLQMNQAGQLAADLALQHCTKNPLKDVGQCIEHRGAINHIGLKTNGLVLDYVLEDFTPIRNALPTSEPPDSDLSDNESRQYWGDAFRNLKNPDEFRAEAFYIYIAFLLKSNGEAPFDKANAPLEEQARKDGFKLKIKGISIPIGAEMPGSTLIKQ